MNAPSFTNWSKSGSGRSLRFHQSADCGPRLDRWRAHGVSQTELGCRHHRAPAHQHGPLRRRHRADPVAGLRLGALCAARPRGYPAVIPIYRASQAAPCAEAGGQTPADLGPAQDPGRGFRFVRCHAARAGACSAADPARPRPRSAELEQVPGAVNGGGESGAGRARPNARLGSGDHCRAFHRRPDPFHLRTPTGYRRAPPAVQVLLGPHPDAFLCFLPGGESGAVGSARLHSGAGSPGLASAPGTESWRLGIHPATALAQPGSGGGLLSPAVLFAHLGRVRPHPSRHPRSGPRQVARKTQTYRAPAVLSWKIRGLRSPNIAHHNHSALQLAADASVERNPFPTGDARTSTFWPVHRHEPLPAAHPYPPDCRASVSPVFSFDDAPATLFASQNSPHCLNRRVHAATGLLLDTRSHILPCTFSDQGVSPRYCTVRGSHRGSDRMRRTVILAIGLLGAAVAIASAQTGGQITGEARDPSGALVPNASVTVTNTATSVARSTTTNTAGIYSFHALTPGTYVVKVAVVGFDTIVKTNIELQVQQTARVDFTLAVGQATQTVEMP